MDEYTQQSLKNLQDFADQVQSGVNAYLNYSSSKENTNAAIQANKEMLERSFDMQKELNQQNLKDQERLANTSMLWQLQGIKSAGLSPAMLKGEGFSPSQSQGSAPSGSPSPVANPYNPLISSQIQVTSAQARLLNAQADKVSADTENTEVDTILKKAQAFNINELTPWQRKTLEKEVDNIQKNMEKIDVDIDYVNALIEDVNSSKELKDVQIDQITQVTPEMVKKFKAEIANLYSQRKLTIAQVGACYKSIQLMSKEIELIGSNIDLNAKQMEVLQEEVVNLQVDGDLKKFEDSINKKLGVDTATQIRKSIANSEVFRNYASPLTSILGSVVGGYAGARGAKNITVAGKSVPAPSGPSR